MPSEDYKLYPCGCKAAPAESVPNYCPDHGTFDPLRNFAEWVLGAHECEGIVQHIIDNARGALEQADELKRDAQ